MIIEQFERDVYEVAKADAEVREGAVPPEVLLAYGISSLAISMKKICDLLYDKEKNR